MCVFASLDLNFQKRIRPTQFTFNKIIQNRILVTTMQNCWPKDQEMDGVLNSKPQPPNSPDWNVLDLGVFNAIQSLQHQTPSKTLDQLIDCVES
ncbi:hypothetical protein Trydic_g21946 [Trypoxylus dichotomus]